MDKHQQQQGPQISMQDRVSVWCRGIHGCTSIQTCVALNCGLTIGDDERVADGHQVKDLAELQRGSLSLGLQHGSVQIHACIVQLLMPQGCVHHKQAQCMLFLLLLPVRSQVEPTWMVPVVNTMMPPLMDGWKSCVESVTLQIPNCRLASLPTIACAP